MLLFFVLVFIVLVSFSFVEINSKWINKIILLAVCCLAVYIIGTRSIMWPDTAPYAITFKYRVPELDRFEINRSTGYYSEKGFALLTSVIKSFTTEYKVYLMVISALTIGLLYNNLRKYCVYPLLGMCVYIGRFMLGRDFMQIRAALAIMIVVFAIKFIKNKSLIKYFLFILIASLLHGTMWLALPLYWHDKLHLTPKRIYICIGLAIAFVIVAGAPFRSWVQTWSANMEIAETYTMEGSKYSQGKGLANILIYYQILVLTLYCMAEKRLAPSMPYYYIFRDGYLFSTLLLIIFSSFAVLSGRTATIFATFEIFILPSLVYALPQKYRLWGGITVGLLGAAFFYLKIQEVMSNVPAIFRDTIFMS